ncbi:CD7 protein, partial [Alectura lathami]|nr:CD7 protein [Alectura lathami]
MLWTSPLPAAYLFLLILPLFPGQNENKFLEWPTDIVSVWEGDSINITCSMNNSENEVGTYLRTGIPLVNVVFVSKQNTEFIHPDLANRTKYFKEGKNLTITLHNVQKSDSNIYLCTRFFKINGRHARLDGKTTTVVVKAKTHGAVEQSPPYVRTQQGQSIYITCELKSSREDEGILLLKIQIQLEKVLYVSSQNTSTIFPAFANRLEYSKQEKKLVITLHNLQKNDTDIYVCAAVLKNSSQTECHNISLAVVYGLITAVVLLFLALICSTLYCVNIKKYFQKRKQNVVYEDMSYCSRRNTLVRTNTYSTDN